MEGERCEKVCAADVAREVVFSFFQERTHTEQEKKRPA